jgi:hypothetical protein
MASINELHARWRILEICNEATVLAESLGDSLIAALIGAAALKVAESLEAPRALVERMQRDIARGPVAATANEEDVGERAVAKTARRVAARRLN